MRDDERCVRSKEVRTPELIGQINNFMDKDRRVSIETISAQFDISVGTVHTIICEERKMRKICAKFVPVVHILVTDYLTKMGIKTVSHLSYSPDLVPCDIWLFPKLKENLRGCHYETIKEMKEAVTKVIDTRGLSWGLPEVVGMVQVHCRQRLLRRELELYVCTINKSAHTKKVWKLIVFYSSLIQILYRLEFLSKDHIHNFYTQMDKGR